MTATDLVSSQLDTLAGEIQAEVAAAEADFKSAVRHAVTAGEKLVEAKKLVRHGEWLPWLKTNFPGSVRSAQGYMRLARNSANAQALAHLRIEGALRELAAPRSAEPDPVEQIPDYWQPGICSDQHVEEIEEACLTDGCIPLIEEVGDERVWVGFIGPGDEEGVSTLTFHPGWADYCRYRLGDGVRFSTEDFMPYTGQRIRPPYKHH